jgi:hypothetical protein
MYDAGVLVGNFVDYSGLDSEVCYKFYVDKSNDFERKKSYLHESNSCSLRSHSISKLRYICAINKESLINNSNKNVNVK